MSVSGGSRSGRQTERTRCPSRSIPRAPLKSPLKVRIAAGSQANWLMFYATIGLLLPSRVASPVCCGTNSFDCTASGFPGVL